MKQPVFNLRVILFGLVITTLLYSCGEEEVSITPVVTPPSEEKTEPVSSAEHLVFAALSESIDGIWVPKLINPDGTIIPLTDGKRAGQTLALYVDDQKNTYVAGWHEKSNRRDYAVYWKNTVPVLLTDTLKDDESAASDIFVANGDVYVAGTVGSVAVYWKNGIRVDLSNGKSDVLTYSISVSGNDVYVVGAVKNSKTEKYEACYWKNGTEIKLPASLAEGSAARDILVSGEDILITGSFGKGKYWKNGTFETLEAKEGGTGYIYLSNGNVYITGVGRYWKDNAPVNMLSETSKPNIYSIAVLDDVVYLGGFEYINGVNTPRIWKDGTAKTMTDGKHNGAVAAIFAVRK